MWLFEFLWCVYLIKRMKIEKKKKLQKLLVVFRTCNGIFKLALACQKQIYWRQNIQQIFASKNINHHQLNLIYCWPSQLTRHWFFLFLGFWHLAESVMLMIWDTHKLKIWNPKYIWNRRRYIYTVIEIHY